LEKRKFDPEIHLNPTRATSEKWDHTGGRVETVINKNTGQQQFVLDRKQILSTEDGFALSVYRDKLHSKTENNRSFRGIDFDENGNIIRS